MIKPGQRHDMGHSSWPYIVTRYVSGTGIP